MQNNSIGIGSSRRMSLGSYTAPSGGEADKDRRQLLEEWRRQKRAATPQENRPPNDTLENKLNDESSIKRPRIEYMSTPSKSKATPPLPIVHSQLGDTSTAQNVNGSDTSSMLERMKMRRQQRPPLNHDETNSLPPHPPSEPIKKTSICFDDDDSPTMSGFSATKSTMSTPSSNRRYSLASGAKRLTRGRMSLTPTTHGELFFYINLLIFCIVSIIIHYLCIS